MKLQEILYKIDEAILECVDFETGELVDSERINALQMALDDKVDNLACWYKQLCAEASAIKAEKEMLAQRERQKEAQAEQIKNYIALSLDGLKFETPRTKITWRKSESVNFTNESLIPAIFKREVVEVKIDKNEIKKAIKTGIDVIGAEIIHKNNIQIK